MKNKIPNFIDLFAGCGGMSLGLEQAGFEPIYVNELNEHALKSYLINRDENYFKSNNFYSNDIKDLANKKSLEKLSRDFKNKGIQKVDLIVGGPPCQGYSGIGHRRLHAVEKNKIPANKLYKDMAKVIKFFSPKIFLFENVKGLRSSRWTRAGRPGEIFDDVFDTFDKIPNYNVHGGLLLAKNYGVPQNRPRVFIVGIHDAVEFKQESLDVDRGSQRTLLLNKFEKRELRKDDAITAGLLPKQQKVPYINLEDLLGDLIDPKYKPGGETNTYPTAPTKQIQKILRQTRDGASVMGKGSVLEEHKYSNHSPRIQKKFQYMIDTGKNNNELEMDMKTKKFSQRVLPATWKNGSGPWITATSLPDDYVHFQQARSLTVREWARLQMFPDWYKFAGKRTTGGIRRAGIPGENIHERELPKYTQIGNAVPVKLAEAIGKHFLKILKTSSKNKTKK